MLFQIEQAVAEKAEPFKPEVLPEPQPELKKDAPQKSSSFKLSGESSAAEVLGLLQLMASDRQPATMVVKTPYHEKRIYFRNGKIAKVLSINRMKNKSEAGFLMNKLGYLLVRQGEITEQERDNALDLCEANPSLRIGEALIEVGAINGEVLKESLRSQAREIVFSLFIFPEGSYEIFQEDLPISTEDDLSLGVASLLKEAASSASEWDMIRKTIHSLDMVLDFTSKGRGKINSARMTVHQKLILSLINVKRTVQEICVESTMLDFEVHKFLYLLLHAEILEPVGLLNG